MSLARWSLIIEWVVFKKIKKVYEFGKMVINELIGLFID